MKKDLTVSFLRANVIAFVGYLPAGVLVVVHFLVWGWKSMPDFLDLALLVKVVIIYTLTIFAGIIAHEFIHMAAALVIGRISLQAVRFGLDAHSLSPYFHCKVPLEVSVYRWTIAMPGLLLGVLPYILGLATGNPWIMFFGIIFILAAGGDWLILWLLRGVRAGTLVEDHPSRVGCTVIEPDPIPTQ